MANAVIAYRNRADDGTVAVSSNLSLTPPSRLTSRYPQIAKKCRNNGETTWAVIADLGASYSVDTMALIGTNLTVAATARFRGSVSDSSGQTGEAYDSGTLSSLVDANYGALIRRAATPFTARYVRIDVTETGLSYIEAGRLFVGLGSQVGSVSEVNIAAGWTRNRVDQSRATASDNGVIYHDRRLKYRQWDFGLDFITTAEMNGFVEEMSFLNGDTDDVLFISNPDSTNLGRDSIWGLLTTQPLIQPFPVDDIFQRKFTIKERL